MHSHIRDGEVYIINFMVLTSRGLSVKICESELRNTNTPVTLGLVRTNHFRDMIQWQWCFVLVLGQSVAQ